MSGIWRTVALAWVAVIVFSAQLDNCSGQYIEDNASILQLWRYGRGLLFNLIGNTGKATHKIGSRLQRSWNRFEPFPCDISAGRSKVRPTSVHALKPGDIDVVAGLGDSLMCNNGAAARNTIEIFKENRGLSWAAGGQGTWREFTTFPNILKVYNPSLRGYAVNDGYTIHYNSSRLNIGEPGALSEDMLYSAQILLKRMIADPEINVEKHWKIITIMIGANDFCSHICYDRSPETYPERHKNDLIKALRFIKNNIPRSFVNIVPVPPIVQLTNITSQPPECWVSHLLECSCFFGDSFKKRRQKYAAIMEKWVQAELEVSLIEEFQDKEDFAVVFQAFTSKLIIPQYANGQMDLSYLSADCFHLSQKSNGLAGASLFRNMLQPVGQKDINWKDYYADFPCPSKQDAYFKTNLNSKNYFKQRNIGNR